LQADRPVRHDLNYSHYKYVLNNCRFCDSQEMMLMGYTKQKLLEKYPEFEMGVTGTWHDIPFLVSGTHIIEDQCWYWFFATPLANDFFIRISGEAERLIKKSMNKHPDKRHLVQVWSKHIQSVKWLNMLKFKHFSSYYVGDEEIYLVERKRI
jgi:hypothetical protein